MAFMGYDIMTEIPWVGLLFLVFVLATGCNSIDVGSVHDQAIVI